MKIEKYATVEYYGYGFFSEMKGCYGFRSGIIVKANSKNVTSSEWKHGSNAVNCPRNIGRLSLVYVYDEITKQKQWKEYFSGIEFKEIYYDHKFDPYGFVCFDADESIYNIQQGLLFARPDYITADKFANYVSYCHKDDITDIVENLSALQLEASAWYRDVCQAIKEMKEERAKKEAALSGIQSSLEDGFGKYLKQPENAVVKTENEESSAVFSNDTEFKESPKQENSKPIEPKSEQQEDLTVKKASLIQDQPKKPSEDVISPKSIDDCPRIIDLLMEKKNVTVSLEGLSRPVAQRILDYIVGSCYILKADAESISTYRFQVSIKTNQ